MTDEQTYYTQKDDWWEFHTDNKHIYVLFVKMVMRDIEYLQERNLLFAKPIRVRKIFENIKWSGVSTKSPDGYIINNNHFRYYAFMFQCEFPDYAGVFRHRGFIPETVMGLIKSNTVYG